MKRGIKLALSTALVAGVAVVGPAFCLNHSAARQSPADEAGSRLISRSIIKVHTYHGVITLPGTADSWRESKNSRLFLTFGVFSRHR